MASRTDLLAEDGSASNMVIANLGDPAFAQGKREERPVQHFLHIVSYLLYADHIAIPARFVMDAEAMAEAFYWCAPLLREGLIIPERRAGPDSFADVARERGVPELGLRRAEYLDATAVSVRRFVYKELGQAYLDLLRSDLAVGGAFRKVVSGGIKGRAVSALNQASDIFERDGNFNPESFAQAVGRVDPPLRKLALRWAMARYYTTPLLFDQSNTRQLPGPAARMLIRGGVLDVGAPGVDLPAPVREASTRLQRLQVDLSAGSVMSRPQAYCEALLEVRQRVPEARTLFTNVRDSSVLADARGSLTEEFERELKKQLKVRTSPGKRFEWVSTLSSGLAGFGLSTVVGAEPETQAATAVGSAVLGKFAQSGLASRISDRRSRKRAPWLLAIDRAESKIRNESE